MARAEVGDDVFGEDPTVNRLQERVAALYGKEAALYVPSGTMANQLALLVHCRPGDEVIIGEGAHNANFESGAGAALAGVQLDGARLLNAAIATGRSARDLAAPFDTASLCLSKGLGAPVGSLLAGGRDFIREAHRWRKRLGGGMRQVGVLAAAGLYALDHHVERLAEDHAHARTLAEGLAELPGVKCDQGRVQTNLVYFDLETMPAPAFTDECARRA